MGKNRQKLISDCEIINFTSSNAIYNLKLDYLNYLKQSLDIINLFIKNLIENNLNQVQLDEIIILAHNQAGNAKVFGFEDISIISAQLEAAITQKNMNLPEVIEITKSWHETIINSLLMVAMQEML